MKSPKQILIISLLLYIGVTLGYSQNGNLNIKLIDYRLDSVLDVNLGYTLTVSAELTNTDSLNSFRGVLDFGARNRNQNISNESIFNKPPYSSDSVILAPGETVPAVFSIDIETPYFTSGPDVVVVWPIAPTMNHDSLEIYLNIFDPTTIADVEENKVAFIRNPDGFFLIYRESELNIEQVRIFDLTGRLITFRKDSFLHKIPMQGQLTGLYILEIITADSKRKVIKVIW